MRAEHYIERPATARGALLLGGLLVAVFAIALFVSVRVYGQLGEAAAIERALVGARQAVDEALQYQIDEQTAVRGFLLTGSRSFLADYNAWDQQFDRLAGNFGATTEDLNDPAILRTMMDMDKVHERWEREVAMPLMHDRAVDVNRLETLGKLLIDQVRSDARNIGDLLQVRLEEAQSQLRRRIDESLFSILALAVVFASAGIAFVAARARLQARIEREREIVETLEAAFRSDLDQVHGLRIASAYSSATRDAAVGGDLFDVRRLDSGGGLVLMADVSGKGIDAAVDTAFVKYTVRTLASDDPDPARMVAKFNALFLDGKRDPGRFVVMFVGVLDPETMRLFYASAGHSGAFLRRDGEVRSLEVTGPVVGLGPEMTFERATLALQPGDLIVLATDGFLEARDRTGEMLGDRGIPLVRDAPAEPVACAESLIAALRDFSGGELADDLALLVIAVDGAP